MSIKLTFHLYMLYCSICSSICVEAKLHEESRLIQRCFDDNKDDDKGDDKKLKGQSKNEFKMLKIESRTLQDSRGKLISRIKNQDSRIKLSRIKIKIQDSRFKNQEKT